jgi:hypothetical protein
MAWDDSSEIRVAGSGQVYTAPVGTALPSTAVAALNAAFSGLGFHSEDGVSTNATRDSLEVRVWQSLYVVRSARQSADFRLTFALMQWNEQNVPLAFGGGSVVSDGGSGYRFNPPLASEAEDYRSIICDVVDGNVHNRFVLPRALAVEGVESQWSRGAPAELPITIQAQPTGETDNWYLVSDDAASFAPGS